MNKILQYILLLLFIAGAFTLNAQKSINDIGLLMDYSRPVKYEIGGVTVSGAKYSDANAIILYSGLKVGSTIELPGSKEIQRAIKNLWKQRLFQMLPFG